MATLSIKRPQADKAGTKITEIQSVTNLFLADKNLADGLSILLEEKVFDPSNHCVREFEKYCYTVIKKCFSSNFAKNYFPLEPEEIRGILLSAKDSQTAEFNSKEFIKGKKSCYIILGQNFLRQHVKTEDRLAAILVHECLHLWRRKADLAQSNSKPEEADCNIQCMHILHHAGYNHMAVHDLFEDFSKLDTGIRAIFGSHIESVTMARLLKDESGRMTANRRQEIRLLSLTDGILALHYAEVFYSPIHNSFFRSDGWWNLSSGRQNLPEALRVAELTVDLLCSDKLKDNYYLFWKAMSTMAYIKEAIFKDDITSNLWRGHSDLHEYEKIAYQFIKLQDFVYQNEAQLSSKNFRSETIGENEHAQQDLYSNYRFAFNSGLGTNQYIRNKFAEFIDSKSRSDLAVLSEEIVEFILQRPDYEFSVDIKITGFLGAFPSNLEYESASQTYLVKNPQNRFQKAINKYFELAKNAPQKAEKLAYVLKLLKIENYLPEELRSSPRLNANIRLFVQDSECIFTYDSAYNLIKVERKIIPKEPSLKEAIETLPDKQKQFFRDFINYGYYDSRRDKESETLSTENEKTLWNKQKTNPYTTNWSELKRDWHSFFKAHIRQISCPIFDTRPSDWQLRFSSELESFFKTSPDQIKSVANFFIENNLWIPRILFECKDHKLRSELISSAMRDTKIERHINGHNFYIMPTAKLYYNLYDRDLNPDFNPSFRNFFIRFFMTSSDINWHLKDWFYLRSARRFCNNSYDFGIKYNRGVRLTTKRAQILFRYKAPESIDQTFDLFQPKKSERLMGLPISQELSLLESERLLLSGTEKAQSSHLIKILEYAYVVFSTERIQALEHQARKIAIKNFQIRHNNPAELIEEYFNQKRLNLKLNHISINQIYELENQILKSLESIAEPSERIKHLELLLLDKNARLEDAAFSRRIYPGKKLYSIPILDQLSELYSRTFTEIYGKDNKNAQYHDTVLSKIKQIIVQSTCPKKLIDGLLISINAQESICMESELLLRNVFINTHLYEEICLEFLISELNSDQYSINATRLFLTTPLSDQSRNEFAKILEDRKGNFFSTVSDSSDSSWQRRENANFKNLISAKSHSHLLELASAFYLTFWSFGIKERAFILDKIILPPDLDADLSLRAQKIHENYQIAKQIFFCDSQKSPIISDIADSYFEALNQIGQQKTEKARLLVSALMIARNPMAPAGDIMQSCSKVISACFFEIGDKLMQCLDSAGFAFPDSKYKASPLGQIASWQLLRSREIKVDQLNERLGSGGAAVVYRITKDGKELAIRIQREGIQQKSDDYINELKLTAGTLGIKDSKYKLANEIVSTLELAISKEIRPKNWRNQIDLHTAHYNNKTYNLNTGRKIIFRTPRITELNTEQAYFISEIASGTEIVLIRDIIQEQELQDICNYQIITDLSAELSGLASCSDRHSGQVKFQRDGNNFILWQLDPVGFEIRHPSQPELQCLAKIISRSISLPVIVSKGATGFFELLEQESDKEINNPYNPEEIVNFIKLRRLGWHARKDFIRHTTPGELINNLSSLRLHTEIIKQLNSWQKAFLRS